MESLWNQCRGSELLRETEHSLRGSDTLVLGARAWPELNKFIKNSSLCADHADLAHLGSILDPRPRGSVLQLASSMPHPCSILVSSTWALGSVQCVYFGHGLCISVSVSVSGFGQWSVGQNVGSIVSFSFRAMEGLDERPKDNIFVASLQHTVLYLHFLQERFFFGVFYSL